MSPTITYAYLDNLMTKDDEVFFKQLGKRIAELRKEVGLTQVQLAEFLGISQQHMASFEAGRRKVSSSDIPKLAQLFAITTDELLGIAKAPAKRGPASTLQRQVEQVKNLPKNKQKFISEMLDALIKQQQSA
ncbi:DNA-binding XRE family transcriptional regulator [Alteromonadaceae bacterium 2753L.S.0a.02]|nr:DNA-binding XRE family transcriptional regulator [Alteromonadaceae bacterium 2753L.S.0a.02]